MPNHTPGPWIVLNDGLTISEESRRDVIPFEVAKVVDGSNEDRANAHLIAAAPDLLSALERMLNAYEADKVRGCAFGNDQAADQARAAIAKAEGRS